MYESLAKQTLPGLPIKLALNTLWNLFSLTFSFICVCDWAVLYGSKRVGTSAEKVVRQIRVAVRARVETMADFLCVGIIFETKLARAPDFRRNAYFFPCCEPACDAENNWRHITSPPMFFDLTTWFSRVEDLFFAQLRTETLIFFVHSSSRGCYQNQATANQHENDWHYAHGVTDCGGTSLRCNSFSTSGVHANLTNTGRFRLKCPYFVMPNQRARTVKSSARRLHRLGNRRHRAFEFPAGVAKWFWKQNQIHPITVPLRMFLHRPGYTRKELRTAWSIRVESPSAPVGRHIFGNVAGCRVRWATIPGVCGCTSRFKRFVIPHLRMALLSGTRGDVRVIIISTYRGQRNQANLSSAPK